MQTSSADVHSYLVIPVCVTVKLSLAVVSVLLMMIYHCS